MSYIMPIFIVGIIFSVIYKIFELFVHRRERLMLVEKLDSGLPDGRVSLPQFGNDGALPDFTMLRIGSLVVGFGLGITIAAAVAIAGGNCGRWDEYGVYSLLLGGLVVLSSGLGAIAGFVIEYVIRKRAKKAQK